jgi:hypothetical protein
MPTTKRRAPFLVLVILLATVATVTTADAHSVSPQPVRAVAASYFSAGCAMPNAFANSFRDYVVHLDTTSDSASVAVRDSASIPVVDTATIQFVTDSLTCHRAAVAHAVQVQTDTLNPATVWTLKVGSSRFIVFNGSRVGERFLHFVFDSSFVHLETM